MSEAKPCPPQSQPTAPMGSTAPVHGAPYQAGPTAHVPNTANAGPPTQYPQAGPPAQYAQAGPPAQYPQAGPPAQYAQPMVIQHGYQQLAPHTIQVVTQPPRPPRVYDNYRARQSVILGAIQITVGILSFILNVIGIILQSDIDSYLDDRFYSVYEVNSYHNASFYQGYGISCGIFYILAGSFAISAAKKKTKCPIIANMVLSILAAIFVWTHISWAAVGVGLDASHPRTVYSFFSGSHWYTDSQWSTIQGSLALCSIMLIIGLLEFVVAVWSSALACQVTCCGNTNRPQPYVGPGTQVTYAQYPGQPIGAGWAYTGAPVQPVGPGVTYNTAPAQPSGQTGHPHNGLYANTAMSAPPAYTAIAKGH